MLETTKKNCYKCDLETINDSKMDLVQHFGASINSVSSQQERKISKTGLE